ncbi:Swi3-domain-containing protein [Fistulina hepatica ATCC 64428]|uniref:Chromosome segregation in meiosis protein n=1 Tax=Fistulina hepatica ATCC 64428 TaxID=1128425 RepID=A0A0D7ALD6_9AGAR|nr:Swi3-domain-containing protein [Fistulina hepatica ATCC 64428]
MDVNISLRRDNLNLLFNGTADVCDKSGPSTPSIPSSLDARGQSSNVQVSNRGHDSDSLDNMDMNFDPIDLRAVQQEARSSWESPSYRKAYNALGDPITTPVEISNGSPAKQDNKKKDSKDDSKEERKRPIILDENRLLDELFGFPQLVRDTREFRIKGKGHEESDLIRLLNVYQHWAHRMYPRTQFRDTTERVEKLCHSRRMAVALEQWKGVADDTQSNDHPLSDAEGDNALIDASKLLVDKPGPVKSVSPSSRDATQPPSSEAEDDGWPTGFATRESVAVQKESRPPDYMDVDLASDSETAEIEAAIRSFVDEPSFLELPERAMLSAQEASFLDDCHEDWDAVDEYERDEQEQRVQDVSSTPASLPVVSTAEENFDDMYE